MSETRNFAAQQQAWGAPSTNNSASSFHLPPPPPAPYNSAGYGTGSQNQMPVNARPPIRPPVESTHFTQAHAAPASLTRNGDLPGPSNSATGQWAPPTHAPAFSAPGFSQNSWSAVNNSSVPWYNGQQPLPPTYAPGTMMGHERRGNFNNLPLPPPPPPPMHPNNAPTNYFNIEASVPHWTSTSDRVALPSETTNTNTRLLTQLPYFGAASAAQHNISYQGTPFVAQQTNLVHSQSYMAAPGQQNLPQSHSYQPAPVPAPPPATHFKHAAPKAPPSTRTQQSRSQDTAPSSAPLQKQQPQESAKTSKNRRKRKRQERKNRVNQEEYRAVLTGTPAELSSAGSSTNGQFSDPVDSDIDEELIILEFLISRFECSPSADNAGPDVTLFRDLELSCEKLRELEQLGNRPLVAPEFVERRTRLVRRAQEILSSKPSTISSSGDSSKAVEISAAKGNGRIEMPTQAEKYTQKAAVSNHAIATGSAAHSVEFAVGSESKETIPEASVPRKSASRALEEAKAKLRLAKLQMSLAAKKKALQEAKSKSGQNVDPINALLKGGLDSFLLEQISLSGHASKIRFLDSFLDDDPVDDAEEKHSSDMSMDEDSGDDIQIRTDDPPLDPTEENLPVLRDEPSLLQRMAELQNLSLSKLKNFESGTKLQRLDKVGLTSLLRDTVDKTMEEQNATLEATSSLGSSKESKASTRALLKKRKEEALRSRAVAHHKSVISKQQRMLRKQQVETEQIDQSIRVIDEEVLMLSNQQCPDLREKIRNLEGRKHVLDDMLAGYLAELMGLRKELHTHRQQLPANSSWALSSN